MKDRSCEECRWWDNSTSSGHDAVAEVDTGYCRRSTPGFDSRTGLAVWPFTEADDWCGEFLASAVGTIAERQDPPQ